MPTTAGRVPPSCSSLHSSPCSACLQAAVKGGFGLCSASARRERTTSPSLRQVLCGNAADPRAEVTLSGGDMGPWAGTAPGRGALAESSRRQAGQCEGKALGPRTGRAGKCLPSPHFLSLVPGGRWCHQPSLFGRGQELGLPRQCCLWGRWSGELETVVLGPWVPLPPPFPGGSARPGDIMLSRPLPPLLGCLPSTQETRDFTTQPRQD